MLWGWTVSRVSVGQGLLLPWPKGEPGCQPPRGGPGAGLPGAAWQQRGKRLRLLGWEKEFELHQGRGREMSKSMQLQRRFTPPLLQNQTAFKAVCYMKSNGSLRMLNIDKFLSLPCFSVSRKTKMQIKIKQKKMDLRKNFPISFPFSFPCPSPYEKTTVFFPRRERCPAHWAPLGMLAERTCQAEWHGEVASRPQGGGLLSWPEPGSTSSCHPRPGSEIQYHPWKVARWQIHALGAYSPLDLIPALPKPCLRTKTYSL